MNLVQPPAPDRAGKAGLQSAGDPLEWRQRAGA